MSDDLVRNLDALKAEEAIEITATFKCRVNRVLMDHGHGACVLVQLADHSRGYFPGECGRGVWLDIEEIIEVQPATLADDDARAGKLVEISREALAIIVETWDRSFVVPPNTTQVVTTVLHSETRILRAVPAFRNALNTARELLR